MPQHPMLFDSARIARYHARAKKQAAAHGFLRQRALRDILSRLQGINRTFHKGLLVSPFGMDPNALPGGVHQVKALPHMAPQSLDLVISLLHLHVENDLPGQLWAIRQALRPDGLFLGALFGDRTLHELRHALLEAESTISGGAQARIIPFADLRALGGLMQAAGFALPVVDADRVKVRYGDILALMHDLRGMGESNPLSGPLKPLRRDVLAQAQSLYRARHGDANGRLGASFDIVHLIGWAPHESQPKPLQPGSAQVSLKQVLGQKPG